jgi:hypothetical protein
MNLCQDHWDRLRAAIDKRGLSHLIAQGGEEAAKRTKQELEQGAGSKETFDPLMFAFFAIGANVMDTISKAGGDPLYLMTPGPEDPVEISGYEERTWPKCGLCYLGLGHEMTCRGCSMPKVDGYAWMIDRAADDSLAKAKEYGFAIRPKGLPGLP